MKVLYAIPALVQGGAERFIVETIRRLHGSSIQASIVTFRSGVAHYGDLLPSDLPLHSIDVDGAGWTAITRMRALIERERPDVIHSFMEAPNFVSRLAAHLAHAPRPAVVTQVCGNFMRPQYLALERLLSGLAARPSTIIANSGVIKRELTRFGRVPESRIVVLPNFVDLARFRVPSEFERRAAKKRWGVDGAERVFVFPAMHGIAKGHITFLYALARAKREGALRGAIVLLAGRARDRLPTWLIPRLIKRLDLAETVRDLGAVADMPSLFAAADWAVMPSWYEGGAPPMAVLEALACGVPTIVSTGADGDGRLAEAHVGFVIRVARLDALATTLARAAEMRESERVAKGLAGRSWVLREGDPDRAMELLMAVYRTAAGRWDAGAVAEAGTVAGAEAVADAVTAL